MKKYLSLILVLLISSSSFAQTTYTAPTDTLKKKTGLYIRLGAGYAFPQAGQTIDVNRTPYAGSINYTSYGSTYSYSIKRASFSAGIQAAAGIGYMLNKNVGIQLDVAVGVAPKNYSTTADSNIIDGYAANEIITQQAKSVILLIPALYIQTGGEKLKLYARGGIVLPVKDKVTAEVNDMFLTPAVITSPTSDTNVTVLSRKTETTSGFSLGFSGAMGIRDKLNDNWHLWLEASLLSLSFYAKETDVTKYTINGNNELFNLTGNNLKYQYGKSGSGVTPSNNVGVSPAYSLPFSNFGINVGVTYSF